MGDRQRILSEAEAAEILRAAAELQESSGTDYSAGVTLDELRRIAVEAGIAPEFLEKAIQSPVATRKSSLFRISEQTEIVLDGEVAPGNLDLVLAALRDHGSVSQYQQVGRTLTGTVTKAPMSAHVDISSRGGRTRVKVRSTPFLPYFLGLHVPLIGACVAGPVVGSWNPLAGIGVALATLATGLGLFQLLNRKSIQRSRGLADGLRNEVAKIVDEPAPAQTTTAELTERLDQTT